MIYLDASVVVALLTGEPASPAIKAGLHPYSGMMLHASGWTAVEAASALSIKRRTGALQPAQHAQALAALDALFNGGWMLVPIVLDDFAQARTWVGQAALGVRGGDALHLAITHRLGFQLATLDKPMAAAAGRLGVPSLPFAPPL